MTILLKILFGASWRFVDGRPWQPKLWNGVFFAYILWQLYPFDSWALAWLYVWTAISVLTGYETFTQSWAENGFERLPKHGWQEWDMWHRFLVPAALGCAPLLYVDATNMNVWFYMWATVPVGLAWPVCTRLDIHTAWAEALMGAVVIGGLAWI